MTTTTRMLSVAAIAAFASLGAQADTYGASFTSDFQSTRDRAEVRAEAAQAVPNFKNFVTPTQQPAVASASRSAVQADAVAAARAGVIATGNRS